MPKTNLADPEIEWDETDPEGYRCGLFRPGPSLGAKATGSSVYVIPPGQSICPYHWEAGEEEWLLVLQGSPTLREPDGETLLEPMDLCFFPAGPEGAHKVTNATDTEVRVLMYSELKVPGASVYPDSDKVGVWTGHDGEDRMLRRTPHLEYFDGEPGTDGG